MINEARERLGKSIADAVARLWNIEVSPELSTPDNLDFGDLSTNVAFQLAKVARKSPHDIAKELASNIDLPKGFSSVEPAGGGFLNFRYEDAFLQDLLAEIIAHPKQFGRLDMGTGQRIQIEFVSANPTGPLNVVSARAAAVGSALVNVLRHAGFDVTAEYYINDAGNQVRELALSFALRLLERMGFPIEFGADSYRGEYLKDEVAIFIDEKPELIRELHDRIERFSEGGFDPKKINAICEGSDAICDLIFGRIGGWILDRMIDGIRGTLNDFNAEFDSFFSEKKLRESGAVEETLDLLRDGGST
ncbi:hypothetical protein J7L01_04215, partial [bacterium]|nr:hypothetical protein [bacterium]